MKVLNEEYLKEIDEHISWSKKGKKNWLWKRERGRERGKKSKGNGNNRIIVSMSTDNNFPV